MDEELQAQLDAVSANYQQRLAAIQRRQELARRVTATARSRNGQVSVEVGAQGQLLRVMLDPGIYDRLSPQRLAAALTELAKTAAADAAAQVHEIMGPAHPPRRLLPEGGTRDDP
jgi:DNA-binding protein YbaB